ncbi:MAG: peptide ABC transporter substrate-binding protein [Anaerolineae bacterium]
MQKRIRFVLALAMIFAMVFAFASIQAPAQAQGSVLTVGFAQEPDNMNGFYSSMAFAQWAIDLVQASLWHYTDTLEAVPVLVAEIPTVENGGINADYTEYTIKLKPDLKWSDGEALNADDLVFTYEMIMKGKENNFLQAGVITEALESVSKVDDTTFKLVFKSPQTFPEDVAGSTGLSTILPEHVFRPVFEANGSLEQAEENQNPTVFSGPYTMTEWLRGESMTFAANPNYVLGAPKIATIVIRFFPDTQTQYAALGAGQIDMVPNVSEGDLANVKSLNPDIAITNVFGGYIESLWLNVRDENAPRAGHPALKDKNVRAAIRLALDRRAIVRDLLADAVPVSDSIYALSPFEDKELGFVESNKEEAAKLLDEAGWVVGADGIREKDGVKMELRYSTTTAGWRNEIQAVVQQQLAEVGIAVVLEKYPASEFFGAWASNGINAVGEYDIAEYANNTALTNISNVTVNEAFACDQITSEANPGGQNFTGFCSEELDAAAKITRESLDPAERQAAAKRIQEIVRDEMPVIVLFPRGDNYAYNTTRFTSALKFGSGVGNMWFDLMNWELK